MISLWSKVRQRFKSILPLSSADISIHHKYSRLLSEHTSLQIEHIDLLRKWNKLVSDINSKGGSGLSGW